MKLGRLGVFSRESTLLAPRKLKAAIREIEHLGYGTVWIPESLGARDVFVTCTLVLEWSTSLSAAAGVANIWARDPIATRTAASTLADAFPDRFILGLGVGNRVTTARRGQEFLRPVDKLETYLDSMAGVDLLFSRAPQDPVTLLGVQGPKLIDVAARRKLGVCPYFVPALHTRLVRQRLGAKAILAPEHAVILNQTASDARRIARQYTSHYLRFPNYRAGLIRLGWRQEDLRNGATDEIVDSLVAWGTARDVLHQLDAHFHNGANHLAIQPLYDDWSAPQSFPLSALEAIAIASSEAG